MEVCLNNKCSKELKENINFMSTILFEKLKNWKDLKPIHGLILDDMKIQKRTMKIIINSLIKIKNMN